MWRGEKKTEKEDRRGWASLGDGGGGEREERQAKGGEEERDKLNLRTWNERPNAEKGP